MILAAMPFAARSRGTIQGAVVDPAGAVFAGVAGECKALSLAKLGTKIRI